MRGMLVGRARRLEVMMVVGVGIVLVDDAAAGCECLQERDICPTTTYF